jgi:Ni,Fe-hydrogenase III large subunit
MSLEEMLATLDEITADLSEVHSLGYLTASEREARIQMARESLARLVTESAGVS